MLISWNYLNSITIVSFEMDELRDPEPLRNIVASHIKEGRKDFLINLENVIYISSSVLGLFITFHKELKEIDGCVKLVNAQPSVSSLLEMTRLDKILELFNDIKIAIKSFE